MGLFGTSGGPIKPQQVAGTSVPLYRPLLVALGGPISKCPCETCDNVYTRKDNLEKHIGRQTSKQQQRTRLNLNKFGEHLCPRPLLLAFDSAGSETTAENLCGSQLRNATLFACSLLSKPARLSLSKWHSFDSLDVVKNLAEGDNILSPMFATYIESRQEQHKNALQRIQKR